MELFNEAGTRVAESVGAADDEHIAYVVPTTGTYSARVFGWVGEHNSYTVTLSTVTAPATCFGLVATVTGSEGGETLTGTAGNDVIAGLGGNDTISGLGGVDVLCGGTGDDLVLPGSGSDVQVDGGVGVDTISYADATTAMDVDLTVNQAVVPGGGTTDNFVSFENAVASPLGGILFGSAGPNTLTGLGGVDTLKGSGGNDILDGGLGKDSYQGGSNDDLFKAQDGIGSESIGCGSGVDTVQADPSDIVNADCENHTVNTPPTISNIADQTTPVNTVEGPLAFTVGDAETAVASLTVTGSSSNQTLVPNANITFGGSGANRTVTVTPASNQTGTATITVTVSDGALTGQDTFVQTVTASGATCFGLVATVTGSEGGETLTGTAGNDVIAGLGGNDTISGLGGVDVLCGGTGDDLVLPGSGSDVQVDGGVGVDTISYADATTAMDVDLTVNQAVVPGGGTTDNFVSFENAVASPLGGILFGSAGPNTLTGLGGVDTLKGSGGNDILDGGLGKDSYQGGSNDDLFKAQDGIGSESIGCGSGVDTVQADPSDIVNADCENHTVNTPPTISNIADQTTPVNTVEGPLAFTVGDAETAVASLTVTGSSSNQTLVPNANITFGGSGANRTVTVTPASNQTGTATITVTVSDGALTGQDTFVQTVTASGATCFGLVATVTGSEGGETLTGTAGNDVIAGLGGNDTISGLGGVDVLCGGTGDDLVLPGSGSDVQVDGGVGVDTISYADATTAMDVDLTVNQAVVPGGGTTDNFVSFENAVASPLGGILFGSAGPNTLTGLAGSTL